jgi:phage terminase small subunit
MRGRKPVPTTLRKLHGNPRKVGLPKFEPKPDGDLSTAPEWLTEEQKTGWAYALTNSPPGMLKQIDRSVLVVWAVAEDLHRQAATAQAQVGLLMRVKTRATMNQDDPGVPAASSYINIINQQAKIMLKAASELGVYAGLAAARLRRPVAARSQLQYRRERSGRRGPHVSRGLSRVCAQASVRELIARPVDPESWCCMCGS